MSCVSHRCQHCQTEAEAEVEAVLFRAPCLVGEVGISQLPAPASTALLSDAESVFLRRLRFFHLLPCSHATSDSTGQGIGSERGQDDGDMEYVSDEVQSEVEVVYPFPVDVVEQRSRSEDMEDVILLLRQGRVRADVLSLSYHRAMLAAMSSCARTRRPDAGHGSAVVIGVGCGALVNALINQTSLHIVGVEIDAGVLALGREFFGMGDRAWRDRVEVVVGDGLDFVKVTPRPVACPRQRVAFCSQTHVHSLTHAACQSFCTRVVVGLNVCRGTTTAVALTGSSSTSTGSQATAVSTAKTVTLTAPCVHPALRS